MNPLKRFLPIMAALLGVTVIGVEIVALLHARADARRALVLLQRKQQECEGLARLSPAPSIESEIAISNNLTALRRQRVALRAALQAGTHGPSTASVPAKPAEAYFALAEFTRTARAQADAARVMLRPGERFGFSAYVNEGPATEVIVPVHRQREAVQSVLETLFLSRPLALLAVRRTAPIGAREEGRGGSDDFFSFDPALSMRAVGQVETEPLRFEFTGQTSTLRTFLSGLARTSQPIFVRSIDVEPPAAGDGAPPDVDDMQKPMVRRGPSRFSVTVEWVSLAGSVGEQPR